MLSEISLFFGVLPFDGFFEMFKIWDPKIYFYLGLLVTEEKFCKRNLLSFYLW